MSKSISQGTNAALRTVTAIRIHDARRVLQVVKESLDNVARATKVRLISSTGEKTHPDRNDK